MPPVESREEGEEDGEGDLDMEEKEGSVDREEQDPNVSHMFPMGLLCCFTSFLVVSFE